MTQKIPPIHPGEILLEEFLKPLGISQNRLARDLATPVVRVNEIVRGKRTVTVDSALRLAKYFKTTPQFWLNLQAHYDLEMAKETHLVDQIDREVRERELVSLRN
ncbi:MAG: HigA family addiction module antitoxin [Desulfobacca sp.]|nr:HigA family addiction module antitoxin [Desulfobacca sp.]